MSDVIIDKIGVVQVVDEHEYVVWVIFLLQLGL